MTLSRKIIGFSTTEIHQRLPAFWGFPLSKRLKETKPLFSLSNSKTKEWVLKIREAELDSNFKTFNSRIFTLRKKAEPLNRIYFSVL